MLTLVLALSVGQKRCFPIFKGNGIVLESRPDEKFWYQRTNNQITEIVGLEA